MEKLIYLGKELDVKTEHELINNFHFGVNCFITNIDGTTDTRNNCTEVHHIYDSLSTRERIAFESDLHGTGGTRDIKEIQSVVITKADKMEDHY